MKFIIAIGILITVLLYLEDTYHFFDKKIDSIESCQKDVPSCEEACKHSQDNTCLYLGKIYLDGNEKDFFKASSYFSTACSQNNPEGCNELGKMYINGQGLRQSEQEGIAFMDQACSNQLSESCLDLAEIYKSKNDLDTAKEYYGKACDLHEQSGCDSYRILNLSK